MLKNSVYDIDLIEDLKLPICAARRILFAIRDEVIQPINEPIPAVLPMVVVRQNNIRIDSSSMNKNLKRRHFPLGALEEIAARNYG